MKLENLLYVGLIIFTAATIVNPMFKEGFLVCQDNPPHLAESYFLIENLLPNNKLFGWSDIESAGFPIFVNYYPLGFWILAVMNTLPWLNVISSYKLLVFISYVAPSIGIFLLLKRIFSSEIGIIVAIMLLFQYDFLSFTINGIWSQYLSLLFAIIYIILVNNLTDGRYNIAKFSLVGAFAAMTFLSHLLSFLFIILYTLTFLAIHKFNNKIQLSKILPYFLFAGVISLILSSIFFIPTLQTLPFLEQQQGVTSKSLSALTFKTFGYMFLPHLRIENLKSQIGWSPSGIDIGSLADNLSNFVSFSFLNVSEIIFSIISLLGMVIYIKDGRKNIFLTITMVTLVISTVFGSGVLTFLPLERLPLLTNLLHVQAPRYLLYARITMAIFSANGIMWLIKTAKSNKHIGNLIPKGLIILILIVVYLMFHYSLNQLNDLGYACMKTSQNAQGMGEINSIWSWVSKNVDPSESRVMYQNTFGNSEIDDLSGSHIFALSTHQTRVQSVGTWQGAMTTMLNTASTNYIRLFNSSVYKITDEEIAEWLKLYNAKHIVSSESVLKNKLGDSELFVNDVNFGNFSIFSLQNYAPTWIRINGVDVEASVISLENENKIFGINSSSNYSDILVKVAYHPYWKASINGEEVKIMRSDKGFIILATNKIGNLTLVLEYKSPIPI